MAIAGTSSSIVDRMVRAGRLEVALYEEVEADVSATNQALVVVAIAAVASGIGAAIGAPPGALVGRIFGSLVSALIAWALWSFVLYWVGTRLMGGTATFGELLRTLGFAATPITLLLFSFIPILGGIVALIAVIWWLVASFIGTRQALDLDNGKTAITILIGAVGVLVIRVILALLLGVLGIASYLI